MKAIGAVGVAPATRAGAKMCSRTRRGFFFSRTHLTSLTSAMLTGSRGVA